jgi:hypothetical protein
MSDMHGEYAEQLRSVRPTTQSLITSIMLDSWPSPAAVVDFGIDSQKHYEALYYPVREGEIMPKALDAALGNGAKLTALVRESATNPHNDVQFHTSWDLILGRECSVTADKGAFKRVLNGKSADGESRELNGESRELTKDRGIEM